MLFKIEMSEIILLIEKKPRKFLSFNTLKMQLFEILGYK